MKCLLKISFVLFVFVANAQNKKPVVASDLMKIATTSQIQVSPDGGRAIMVVNKKATRGDNEYYYTRQLFLYDLTGKDEPKQLTFGDKNDGQPRWSPDGKTIAFVRADGDKPQIWILPLTGGEAHAITKAEYGASRPRWSPDGKKILFTSNIPFYAMEGELGYGYERPGRKKGDEPNWKALKGDDKKNVKNNPDGSLDEVRAWLAKNAVDNNPRVVTRQNLQGELNLQPEEEFSHLFVKTVDNDDKPVQLTSGFQDFGGGEWAPDGKKIICHSRAVKSVPDKEVDADLWIVDVDAKNAKEFLAWADHSSSNPQYSPDGTQILFNTELTTNRHSAQNELAVVAANGGTPTMLTGAFDRDAGLSAWSADGKSIYFTAQTEGRIPLFQVAVKGGNIIKVIGEENGINDFDLRGDKVVYALTQTRNPWEVYAYTLSKKENRQLTRLNEEWVKDRAIVSPKEHWIERPDGFKIQYWVMEPVNRKENVKYPTILNIHGGPSAMWGPGIFSMWHEYQLENSWGYGVVYSNPRGSGGYGDKFMKANFKNWGTDPMADIISCLEDAQKNYAWIDKDNLVVEGGSYAGYMVAWIVSHDNRFKAANAQRGVYDLGTFMGEGNAWRLVPGHFGGYPWEKETREVLTFNSPITYVDKINTPLLIIHGDQDLRTGVTQSEMLYKSLKILGKPVEYIRYPKEGHELTRSGNPGRMMDHLLRTIEFFERYVKHPEPPPATTTTTVGKQE